MVQVFGSMLLGCLGGRPGLMGLVWDSGWMDVCNDICEAHNETWRLTVVMMHTRG